MHDVDKLVVGRGLRPVKSSAFVALSLLLTVAPVAADLGEAESATSGQTSFEVWCSKQNNDCNVEISDEKVVVNGKGGVERESVS